MCLCLHLDDHVASTTLYCTLSGECAVHGLVYVNAVTLSSPGVYFDRFSPRCSGTSVMTRTTEHPLLPVASILDCQRVSEVGGQTIETN